MLAVCALPALADAPRTGVVTGRVVDPDGAPLPGATIQLIGGRGTETSITDTDGGFRFVFLVPGQYTVRADLEGFQSAEGVISVAAGGRAAVELQLADVIGGEILVTGETPLVNKYDVSAGGAIAEEELTTVPTTSRGFIQTLNFLPGVANDANSLRFGGFQPGIEGSRGARASYHMDGVDVTMPRLGGATRLQLPMFAAASVKVESSGIDAQYSRTIGGVVTTTIKSGTNDFHGELAWYGQNLDWGEQHDVTPVPLPDELKHSWEVSLGGAIIRDKLWFFAAYGDREDPGFVVLGDEVTALDTGATMEQRVAKLDWQPSANHSFNATYVATPFEIPGFVATCADAASTWLADWPGEFYSASWSWAASDSLFVEVHAANQDQKTNRVPFVESMDPSADPWKPAGNLHVYNDLAAGLFWNAVLAANVGEVAFPREQANVSANWFAGAHDVKAGVDYQHVEWQNTVQTRDMVFGFGYSPDAPGGFARPLFYREVFNPPLGHTTINPTDNWALFVRDRMTFDRWTFNLGLRIDDQYHENDIGTSTVDAQEISPRLSAVYDVRGDGTLLASATAGRYMYQLPQNWSERFNTTTASRAFYTQYGWNPTTQAYDRLQRVLPPQAGAVQQVDPHFKDELTLGVDWAFHPNWAFKAKYLYWEQDEHPQMYNQVDAEGNIVLVAEQNPYSESQRNALHLSVQRRFRDNWMVAAAYTWSETEGNCQESTQANVGCAPPTGAHIDQVNPDTGVPWTLENYDGPLATDRPHVVKLRGLYRMPLGRGHSLNIGGLFFLQSGAAWARTEEIEVVDGADTVIHFLEPRGSHRTPTFQELSLNLEWQFPLSQQLDGALRIDAINVTDEQELIGTDGLPETGEPTQLSLNYQRARVLRVMARVTF
jgi:hypothetical protein